MNRIIIFCLFFIFTGFAALGNDIPVFSERRNKGNIEKHHRDETLSPPKVKQDDHSVIVETEGETDIRVEITTREGETVYACQKTAATTLQIDNLEEGEYIIEIKIEEDSYEGDFHI